MSNAHDREVARLSSEYLQEIRKDFDKIGWPYESEVELIISSKTSPLVSEYERLIARARELEVQAYRLKMQATAWASAGKRYVAIRTKEARRDDVVARDKHNAELKAAESAKARVNSARANRAIANKGKGATADDMHNAFVLMTIRSLESKKMLRDGAGEYASVMLNDGGLLDMERIMELFNVSK